MRLYYFFFKIGRSINYLKLSTNMDMALSVKNPFSSKTLLKISLVIYIFVKSSMQNSYIIPFIVIISLHKHLITVIDHLSVTF